jgi:pimeloyl-ACP methyl ester carboxylesterase
MEHIPIDDGGKLIQLAVRYDRPAGEGSPVSFLYLHGFGSQQNGEKAEFFRDKVVRAGYPFCSFDFRGHGASGGSLRDLTLTRNLEDVAQVAALLRTRGHERLFLVGSSMGAGTALWFAALHPDAVAAGLHMAPALALQEGLLAWAGPERARRWEETGAIHFSNELVSTELGWGLIEDLRTYDLARLCSLYRTPTLLLQGKNDASVPWKSVADFASRCAFGGIDLHLFADGDHRLTDRKERLWALMREFLSGRELL